MEIPKTKVSLLNLTAFIAAVEADGSYKNAAEKLGLFKDEGRKTPDIAIVKAAISRFASDLGLAGKEEHLFRKGSGKMKPQPTELARRLAPIAKELIARWDTLKDVAHIDSQLSGTVRLCGWSVLLRSLFSSHVAPFLHRHPLVTVEATANKWFEALRMISSAMKTGGAPTLALIQHPGPGWEKDIRSARIAGVTEEDKANIDKYKGYLKDAFPLYIAGGYALIHHQDRSLKLSAAKLTSQESKDIAEVLKTLTELPWVSPGPLSGPAWRSIIAEDLERHLLKGRKLQIPFSGGGFAQTIDAVCENVGIAVVPSYAIEDRFVQRPPSYLRVQKLGYLQKKLPNVPSILVTTETDLYDPDAQDPATRLAQSLIPAHIGSEIVRGILADKGYDV